MTAHNELRFPARLLPALALLLAAGLGFSPCARAQEGAADAADAAPPKLAPWSWETTPSHLRIGAALREARRASSSDGPLLQERIIDSGRDAIAAQLDILLRSRVPETSPQDGPQVLSETQRDLLLSALAKMPSKTARAELDKRLALAADDKTARLGAMYALGVIGTPQDIARLVELAPRKADSPELALPHAARTALCNSVAALLRRDAAAWPAMRSALREVDPSAGKVLLGALASEREPRALRILLDVARSNAQLARRAVSLVPSCGSSLNADTDREFLEWIASEFQNAAPDYGRTLLMAVGTLDDGDWVPLLTQRLEDPDSGLREEALASLRKISGMGFPCDVALWRSWYEGEERWHSQRRPLLVKQLALPETPKVLGAIREYSEHRTHRASMTADLLKALEHGKPEVRGLVISILERLGSPAACPALLGMLGDGDTKVAQAAWQALHVISGIEIPHDLEELREIFGRS